MSLKRIVLGMAVAAVLASPAAAATINFDEAWAPTAFNNQVTLGAEYSGQGVVFSGLGGAGGEVLDQNSTFGLNARSGRNFLAFNTAVTAGGEQLDFTSAINVFELFVGSGSGASFWANAYDSLGGLVSSTNISLSQGDWGALSLSGAGITRVQFGSNARAWVADDLSFTAGLSSAVPEPAVWAMMITGFGLAGAAPRRRRAMVALAV